MESTREVEGLVDACVCYAYASGDAAPPVERIGYLCIQGYPKRICSGCTSACNEPVFVYPNA